MSGKTVQQLMHERRQTVEALRRLCAEFGDLEWDDKLHLADVVDKHLGRHLHAIAKELTELAAKGTAAAAGTLLLRVRVLFARRGQGWLECGNCNTPLEPTNSDGLYRDDERVTCTECEAVTVVDVDDEARASVRSCTREAVR